MRKHALPTLGDLYLDEISREDISSWLRGLQSKGVGASTRNQVWRIMRTVMNCAIDDELAEVNPTIRNRYAPWRWDKRVRPLLGPFDIEPIADAFPEPYRIGVWVLSVLGLRAGELLDLRVEHFRLDMRRLDVPGTKTQSSRATIPIPDFLVKKLSAHIDEHSVDGIFMPSPEGTRYGYNNWRTRTWLPSVTQTAFPTLRPHDLKYFADSNMALSQMSVGQLQAMTRHDPTITLGLYTHVTEDALDAAAQMINDLFE